MSPEGMANGAEDDPSRRGRALVPAGDQIDDGDSGDKDHAPIVLIGYRDSIGTALRAA
jgi:hypothetical protein